MTFWVVLFLSVNFTLIATPLLITKLKASGIVDKPGKRRINTEVIPRMGGIVILFSLLIILFSFYQNLENARGFLYGLFIIALCGIIDDIIGLKWNYKFLLQLISALAIIFSLSLHKFSITIFFITFPSILGQFILVIFIVGLINSINLMDGLDGLVAGYSVAGFLPILFLSVLQQNQLLNIILFSTVGSLMAFLKYNSYPAKIFLGDTGSMILGYLLTFSVLSVSSVVGNPISNSLDLSFAIILFSIPLIDTLRVFFIRMIKKDNPFKPDQIHLHHILLAMNIEHKKVVFFIQFYSLIYIFDSLFYIKYSQLWGLIFWGLTSVVLLSSKKIIIYLMQNSLISSAYRIMNKAIVKFSPKYKTYFILFSLIPSFYIIIYLLFHISAVRSTFIFPIVFIIIVSALIAVYNERKKYFASTFYIYINFVIFFVLAFHSKQGYGLLKPIDVIIFYSTISLFLIIMLLLIMRKSILNNSLFFNGFDLSVIIFTSSIFIIDKFIVINDLGYLLPCFVYSLLFYFWYKVIIEMYPKLNTLLYYISFSFPVVAILFAILL